MSLPEVCEVCKVHKVRKVYKVKSQKVSSLKVPDALRGRDFVVTLLNLRFCGPGTWHSILNS